MSRRSNILARSIRRWDLALISVILVAAVARLSWPGLYQLKWDEVRMLTASLRLARYGEWTWLSNNTSWANLPGHSPFNTYLISLPYFFTGDPRVPRLLIGVMGTLAAAVIYVLTRRYFGRSAALVAGLFIAADPHAVEWSSYVWNPNIAQVFLALWLLTGLLGYYEGKP
ncbi:MAG TPA: glycosyltransferase family 39 protein, partial [Aggregatilineaceae bacterium]|nr:glycosyltransferase family 39 protein [Aggregatilineaceae bacterium]